MTSPPIDDQTLLRAQIAAVAARLIAQDGADYGSAKRKAARQVLGVDPAGSNAMPDNAQVEDEVRKYQALFLGQSQPARLRALRTVALQVMEALERFRPYLTGAALNGTASDHSDIHLQLFADSPKDVVMFLLDREAVFELSEAPHFKGARHDPVEMVSFMWRKEGVHADLYELNDLRGALKPGPDGRVQRADIAAVRALLAEPPGEPE